jgi:hypothetical protein
MHVLYSSPNIMRVIISRRDEISGTYGMYCKKRYAFNVMVEKPYGNRPLGRHGLNWVIKTDLT